MILMNCLYKDIKNTMTRYFVRCDSEKYATHKTLDGVYLCEYISQPVQPDQIKNFL